jgi:hypothetical protein
MLLPAQGRRSRSLVAIYKLLCNQFTDILHVQGGIREWCAATDCCLLHSSGGNSHRYAVVHSRGESELPLEGTDPDAWQSKTGLMPR